MQKRVTTFVVGAVLCLGALAAAQAPLFTSQADSVVVEQRWEHGVVVRADRAVIKDGEVQLEGNVRLTLPKP